ncbi:MAG TPA: aldo/keto reductase [Ktedonobacteraceae bacterium]|nr:aldo/keto reductase [Ktedonobacteraceae bacterium]
MNEKTLTAVQNLQTVAQKGGYSLSQMALAWVLRQPMVSSAIIGATRPEQVEENAQASENAQSGSSVVCPHDIRLEERERPTLPEN